MIIKKPIIELINIKKSFKKRIILKAINLEIYEGESLVLVGPGGSGKTLLTKILSLIIPPDEGEIFFYGKTLHNLTEKEKKYFRLKIGVVFQNYALLDSLNIRQNVGFHLDYHSNLNSKEINHKVEKNLKLVNLQNINHLKPNQISGGMKKRVGIARAIIHQPQILFLDDPSAGLDPITTDSINKMILNLHKKLSITIFSVSNDFIFTKNIANRIAILYEGEIYKIAMTKDFFNSKDPLIKQFLTGNPNGPMQYNKEFNNKIN